MRRLLDRLLNRPRWNPGELPRSMVALRGKAPCWCGSDRAYRTCHRPEDQRRAKELGFTGRRKTLSGAFT